MRLLSSKPLLSEIRHNTIGLFRSMDKLILHILNNVRKFVAFNDPLGFSFRTWLDYPELCFVFMPTLTIDPSAIMYVASAEEFEWSVILLAHL